MTKSNLLVNKFNRGVVSPLALGRIDIENIGFSADQQTNWDPRILGSMSLRPGLRYIDSTNADTKAFHAPFIFSNSDTAIVELTNLAMRVRVDETVIQRPSVSTTVSNGDFGSATNWANADEAGATSTITGGFLLLVGTGFKAAARTQTLTISGGDQNNEHALRIVVTQGAVTFRLGSTSGGDEYITETSLGVGTHSLAFTPTGGSAYIKLSSLSKYTTKVDSCTIESSGAMSITTPWIEADLGLVRFDQSGDIIFIAAKGYQPKKIERRATRSWSLVNYDPEDGPYRTQNTGLISITPSAVSGDITLTASQPLFKSTNVGSLYKINSVGQFVSAAISSANSFTNSIQVTGVGATRNVTVNRTGTFVATVSLQRSADNASWTTVATYTTAASIVYNDALDNQIQYYRIGVETGNYTSGTVTASLDFSAGSIVGVARITAFTSSTAVSAIALKDMGGTAASINWSEGAWSSRRGYPSALAFYDSRLIDAGKDTVWGSVTDAFSSYDPATIGDSGPINRSIGSGPVDQINWLLPLSRLIIGGQGTEFEVKTTTLDEPISPTNFNIKSTSTQGSAAVAAVKLDSGGLFVQKSGVKLYEIAQDSTSYNGDFTANDLMKLSPEMGASGITRIAVQRQLDTRIHCVRTDGKVAILVADKNEKITCWVLFETDGLVEDAFVMPGDVEDAVYYSVYRNINGVDKRYLERWALISECQGETLNKQCDSFITYGGASTATITGLNHLEAKTVAVWGNSKDLGTYTVSSGAITLTEAVTDAVIGLVYTADFKSTKLQYALPGGSTALLQRKRINQIGLLLRNTYYQGVKYGPDFDNLDDLPLIYNGVETAAGTVHESFDVDMFPFNGSYDTDPRLCLRAVSPSPCTVLAAVCQLSIHEKG